MSIILLLLLLWRLQQLTDEDALEYAKAERREDCVHHDRHRRHCSHGGCACARHNYSTSSSSRYHCSATCSSCCP